MVLFLLVLMMRSHLVSAATITYKAVDLPDLVVGEDLWQYDYRITNFAFNINQGFTIYFDENFYKNLDISFHTVNSDWDVLLFQPDLNIPAAGAYDAIALVDNASLGDFFSIDFVFTGSGSPTSQPFDIYQTDSQGLFLGLLESDFTIALINSIPEPNPLPLILIGISTFTLVRLWLRH